jgi:hypothetical protein
VELSYALDPDGQKRTVTLTCSPSTLYDLAVSVTGGGTGLVTSAPGSLQCGSGATCKQKFAPGTPVQLTASGRFGGWSGDCAGTDPTCNVRVDAARNVTAFFPGDTTLTVQVAAGLTYVQCNPYDCRCSQSCHICGLSECCETRCDRCWNSCPQPIPLTVFSEPAGISCTADTLNPKICTATFLERTSVTLTADHASWWWGASGCTDTQCTIPMNASTSVQATYRP